MQHRSSMRYTCAAAAQGLFAVVLTPGRIVCRLLLCVAGKPEVEAQIDAVMSKFVARANEVRNQLNSQAWSPDRALDEVRRLFRLCARLLPAAADPTACHSTHALSRAAPTTSACQRPPPPPSSLLRIPARLLCACLSFPAWQGQVAATA